MRRPNAANRLGELVMAFQAGSTARKLIDHLDQAILTKAFQGELVSQDPNDEPADVLLARIRADTAALTLRQREVRHRRRTS
jgi:hypothetical protein